jgi:HK97 gp10 family phage protein
MADEVTVNIKGLDELQRNLEELPDKLQTKAVRDAVKAGANVFKEEMVNRAPKDTGILAQHIDIKTRKQREAASAVTAFIGPNKKEVIHPQTGGKTAGLPRTANVIAKMLEFGTSRMPKKPFMTYAFEAGKGRALDAVIQKLKDFFEK